MRFNASRWSHVGLFGLAVNLYQPALRIMHWLNRTPITERGPEWVSLRAGWYHIRFHAAKRLVPDLGSEDPDRARHADVDEHDPVQLRRRAVAHNRAYGAVLFRQGQRRARLGRGL